MSFKTFVQDHSPLFLYPLLRRIRRRMKLPMIAKRAPRYIPYYQDELSREILNARLRYIKTDDINIFLDLEEKIGVKHHELVELPEGNFSGIVVVYDHEGNNFRYIQRLMSLSDWAGRYRMMKLKDLLRGAEINDDELITCILTPYNTDRLCMFIKGKNLQDRFKIGPLSSMRNDEQYLDVFSPVDDEIVIDAGAYDGMTALRFLKWGGGKVRHVYSFELDPLNVPKCEKNLKGHEDKVTLIPKGTWSESKTIYINSTGGTGSNTSSKGTTPAGLAAIDDVVGDEKVTFIKMDVEGAELESLKGAKNTIIKNHPRLAICAYHKLEDLYELPEYILSLVPEYKFYLRHYCSREWETVLYGFVSE